MGDDDGLVVVSQDNVAEALKIAIKHEKKEKRIIKDLKKGKTTLELFGFNKVLEENQIFL